MQFSSRGSALSRLFAAGAMCAALGPASGVLAMGTPSNPYELDQVADYRMSINNSRAANGQISIHTCSKDKHGAPGTDDRVRIIIRGTGGEREIYDLDMPGNDREADRTDTYAFHFPKGSLELLESFEIEIWGYDTWCFDRVTLKAGGDTLVDDHVSGTFLLTNEWGEPGSHSQLWSEKMIEQPLIGDPTTGKPKMVPAGRPIKRDSEWWQHDTELSNNWPVNICQLPKKITLAEIEKEVETTVGSMISSSDGEYSWGSGGGATITVKTAGAHPVYHADIEFKTHIEWKGIDLGTASVDSDIDIIPSCNPEDGMGFTFTTPKVDVTLSGGQKAAKEILEVFSATLSVAFVGAPIPWAHYLLPEIPTTGPKVQSMLIDQSFCPTFSVAANKDLLMTWEPQMTADQLNVSDTKLTALGLTGSEVITVPDNVLCIDPDSLKKKTP